MPTLTSAEIRKRFLDFFAKRGHAIIPSASLVPENDPSVLFNTAGMQPLVPYLLGQKHPAGKRIADAQKCVRTNDIEEVGDNTHHTFFEMLGNWSLGDYFKKDAIAWSYELITSREEGFGLDPKRLYVTVFEGDETAPRDTESAEIWKSLGVSDHRIYFLPADKNWWSPGDNGPCGPDTEMYYDVTPEGLGDMTLAQFKKADDKQQVVEFWNDVFMEYEKKDGKVIGKLANKNVDTGAGLERVVALIQGKKTAYETDLFELIMHKLEDFTVLNDIRAKRIIADHIRTAVFLVGDGVVPSNTDQGYILRRLIRRAVRFADSLEMKHGSLYWLAGAVIETYKHVYANLLVNEELIKSEIDKEESRFRETLDKGMAELSHRLEKKGRVTGKDLFDLYQSFGFPPEVTKEVLSELSIQNEDGTTSKVAIENEAEYAVLLAKHQEVSRAGAGERFKGGLADHSPMSVKYHTATHMLHQALRMVLGEHVLQKGSNITPERLRFDFSHTAKMSPEEIKKVEDIINEKIREDLPVTWSEIPFEDAKAQGALGVFEDKYEPIVKVYQVGPKVAGGESYSLEICGGPHVEHTLELAQDHATGEAKHQFKIQKEEAVAQGIRRIKAVLA
ncbi:MAG: alanine--tRNA ligase [Patescibacteria group bacterium]